MVKGEQNCAPMSIYSGSSAELSGTMAFCSREADQNFARWCFLACRLDRRDIS